MLPLQEVIRLVWKDFPVVYAVKYNIKVSFRFKCYFICRQKKGRAKKKMAQHIIVTEYNPLWVYSSQSESFAYIFRGTKGDKKEHKIHFIVIE